MLANLRLQATVAACALLFAGSAAAQTVLTTSSWVPLAHPIPATMIVPWGQQVEQATGGRVKLNMLPKAPVGPPQTFDAVRDGVQDVGFTVHGYTPGRFPATKAAEFPFLGNTAEETSVAWQRVHEKFLAKADEHKGVHLLAVFTHGPGNSFNTKRPINTLEDFNGLKIRVGGGVVVDVAKALGASALLKPAPESFELLNSGIADGVFFPKESIKSFKLDTLIKHATLVPGGLYNVSFCLVMNEAKWKALSQADRDAITKVSGESFARLAGKAWDAADMAGEQAMRDAKINIQTASPQLVQAIRSRTESLEKAWYDEIKAKGIDGAAVMQALREEIKKAGKPS